MTNDMINRTKNERGTKMSTRQTTAAQTADMSAREDARRQMRDIGLYLIELRNTIRLDVELGDQPAVAGMLDQAERRIATLWRAASRL